MGALEKCMKFKRGREWSSGHWERYLGREWRILPNKLGVAVRPAPGNYDGILTAAGMGKCKGLATPGSTTPQKDMGEYIGLDRHRQYRTTLGKLSWIGDIRPDMQYGIKEMARGATNPLEGHWNIIRRLFGMSWRLRIGASLCSSVKTRD